MYRRMDNKLGAQLSTFDHDKLDAYKVAIDFIATADDIVGNLPRGRGYLSDQLHRAAMSIPLNIAEGAGEFSRRDKARFYRMAARSATECAAIIDGCTTLGIADAKTLQHGRQLLHRIVSMLTKLARRYQRPVGDGDGDGDGDV